MAIQFGTVDGLVNITKESIRCFVKGIDEFVIQGGPSIANKEGVSYGTAFQRFIDPVYNGTKETYDIGLIKYSVKTKSGAEQSPARGTFCKKMGLLKIDEPIDIFEITPLGKAILNDDITIKEYAFILLSKMGVFKDGEYVDNLLSSVFKYFQSKPTVSQSLLEEYIKKTYNDTSIVKTRLDIILNSLVVTGLIAKVTNDIYVLSGTTEAELFIDYNKRSYLLNEAKIDTSKEYSDYIGNLEYGGILDILSNDNISFYTKFFPNLFKYMKQSNATLALQQIFYGAPGTGKSYSIKDNENVKKADENHLVFRTTFHPDSDYSTFVGCYKPSMEHAERIYNEDELIVKLKEIKNSGTTYPCQKFATKYWRSLKDITPMSIKQILTSCGFTDAFSVEIGKGIAVGQEYLNKEEDGKIIYRFTPQAFTNAYVKAWTTEDKVYLVVEEINRGNCAQIFGDLFQLLDRGNDGFSVYPIDADKDLSDYVKKELADSPRTDFKDGVKEGKKLVLPNNLYIWATMNTSDQSLFPIDSAFKRRWEWVYIPIDTKIKRWYVEINGKHYSWTKFLDTINDDILTDETAEDKHLGFYFCKPTKKKDQSDLDLNVITAETFVGKVLFYLWNDVFKVYGIPANIGTSKDWAYRKFYCPDGTVDQNKVTELMSKLKIQSEEEEQTANE